MYLSKIKIENYRGIEKIEADFNPNINIIIGENGSCKSALIDAIRLLYNIGEPLREISVTSDDFYEKVGKNNGDVTIEKAKMISIIYEFRGLTLKQKGAFYEYMVIDPENTGNEYAKVKLKYEFREDKYPKFSYNTGDIEGQRADYNTFELFQHYYLGALRDSTRDLLSTRNNILGKVIKRYIDRSETEGAVEQIMKAANEQLLGRDEVLDTRKGVNDNLSEIFKNYSENKIGLQIEQAKVEYIVNAIKPFLPHNKDSLTDEGLHLWQNSLGFNNLIYIATVLGDIKEQIIDNNTPHYALLIEEPEAHLHPQLQLNLYNFLQNANSSENSQLFITTHSPTLTSKVPLDNLIVLEPNKSIRVSNQFQCREAENLIEDTASNKPLNKDAITVRKKKLERYIDVTKSQLFYAKACLFVEGISEELLVSAFTELEGYKLEDYRIELINVNGTSFYPFIYLFNSNDDNIRIDKPISILTDDDRFSGSKRTEYSFNNLIQDEFEKIDELNLNIQEDSPVRRISNLNSLANGISKIKVFSAFKTLEYELTLSNIPDNRTELKDNFLFKYLEIQDSEKAKKITEYTLTFENDELTDLDIRKTAILFWKALTKKSEFAQDFSIYLLNNLENAKVSFKVPKYILDSLSHLKG